MAELPYHNHDKGTLQVVANEGELQNAATNLDDFPGSGGPIHATGTQVGNMTGSTGYTGGGTPFNVVQPSVVGYLWKRTA